MQCCKSDVILREYLAKIQQQQGQLFPTSSHADAMEDVLQPIEEMSEQFQFVIELSAEQFQLSVAPFGTESEPTTMTENLELAPQRDHTQPTANTQCHPLLNTLPHEPHHQPPQENPLPVKVDDLIPVDSSVVDADPPFHSDDEMPDTNDIYGSVLAELNSISNTGSGPVVEEESSPALVCSNCQMTYDNDNSLSQHQSLAHPVSGACECDVCGKGFPSQKTIRRHMKTHFKAKPHVCRECGAQFADSTNLNRHTKSHTGELRNSKGQPLACDYCEKLFKWPSSLFKHRRLHTGINVFRCGHCPKVFAERRGLELHRLTHTGEMPFSCPLCEQRFNQKANLKRHLRTHATEEPFRCALCEKSFKLSDDLTDHQKTHAEVQTQDNENKEMEVFVDQLLGEMNRQEHNPLEQGTVAMSCSNSTVFEFG